jgi:hypothetical protein
VEEAVKQTNPQIAPQSEGARVTGLPLEPERVSALVQLAHRAADDPVRIAFGRFEE